VRISQRSIEEVRERVDILEVASEFTPLKRQGARYSGLCPYPDHDEKTPSFSVSPDRGLYYCFGCLEANERIWTSRGLIPIAAAEIGDQVIGLDGRRETITDKWFKSGPTLRIGTGAVKEGLQLTPDHWCVFVKKEEALRAVSRVHLRYSGGDQIRLSSKLLRQDLDARLSIERAADMREGDFWLYPVIPEGDRNDSPLRKQGVIKPCSEGLRRERIEVLPANPGAAWLYGIWLAEGSLYTGGVKWSFGAQEADSLAEKVVLLLEEQFGRPSTKFVRPNKNICEVTCSSTDLAALFGYWFGRGCANKRVPVEALNWTTVCQTALIEGYLDGDGYANGGVRSAATVSQELAYGIQALCIQAGIVCSLSSTPARVDKDGTGRRRTYRVHLLNKESLQGFFAEIGGTRYFWSIVQRIESAREEPTTVVDISTTGSHTYLTKMGITHNCQRGGDAIKLLMELKSFDFSEAVSYLAERSDVELEYEGTGADSSSLGERASRRRKIHRALAVATAYYHKYFLKSDSPAARAARDYLEGRGFSLSTIEEFRIGFAPPWERSGFVTTARRLGIEPGTLEEAGLLTARGGERFAGRITFPISDRRGRIVGFGARALRSDQQPKYLNSPETELFTKRELLYGFPQVAEAMRRERAALIVEGYTDVLMLYQSGIKNAVATLGTASTPGHFKLLGSFVDRVYVLFDPDAAGQRAMERILDAESIVRIADQLQLDLRFVRLSKDPADWLLEHSPDEFKELLAGSVPVIEFVIRRIAHQYAGTDAMSRSRMIPRVRKLIGMIDDSVLRNEAIRLATTNLGVDAEALRTSDPRTSRTHDGDPKRRELPPRESSAFEDAGREVLALMIACPAPTARALERGLPLSTQPTSPTLGLSEGDFANETQRTLFSLLREHAGEELETVLSDERSRLLMNHLVALGARAEELRREDPHHHSSEVSVREAWLRLAILSRERQKRDTQDFDLKDRLQSEIFALRDALRAVAAGP
jgi:DNA primase